MDINIKTLEPNPVMTQSGPDWDYKIVTIAELPTGAFFMLSATALDIYVKGEFAGALVPLDSAFPNTNPLYSCEHFVEEKTSILLHSSHMVYVDNES